MRVDRTRAAGWPGPAAVAAGVLVCAGAALPWVRIGRVDRSAYALARSARNLDLVDGSVPRALVVALFCGPALVGAVLVCVSMGWRRPGGALSALLALLGVLGGGAGTRFSSGLRAGPILTLAGGLLGLIAVVAMVRGSRRSGRAAASAGQDARQQLRSAQHEEIR